MGDRCYMQVTCKREDMTRFEELGFVDQEDYAPGSELVMMVDDQATSQKAAEQYGRFAGLKAAGTNFQPPTKLRERIKD